MKNKMTREEKRAMKKNRKWFKKKRFILPITFIVLFIGLLILGSQVTEEELAEINKQDQIRQEEKKKEPAATPEEPKKEEPKKEVEEIIYQIIQKDDISVARATRYRLYVEVTGEPTKKDLENIAEDIVKKAKKDKKDKFNSLSIGFYDQKEQIGYGDTLGSTLYAPYGEIGKALDVKPGDYKNMEFKHNLREKDWTLKLTKEEVRIYKEWNDLIQKKYEENKDNLEYTPDEDEVTKELATELKITPEEIKDILNRHITWAFNNQI